MKLSEVKRFKEPVANTDNIPICYADLEIPQYWDSLDGLVERYKFYQYVPGCKLKGYADFNHSKITSLKGSPSYIKSYFDLSDCSKLETLEGGPITVIGDMYIVNCVALKSLEHAPTYTGFLSLEGCVNLTSLKGLPKKIGASIVFYGCKAIVNPLQIMFIKFDETKPGIFFDDDNSDLTKVLTIIKQSVHNKSDLLETKAELIEKGFSKYAKL